MKKTHFSFLRFLRLTALYAALFLSLFFLCFFYFETETGLQQLFFFAKKFLPIQYQAIHGNFGNYISIENFQYFSPETKNKITVKNISISWNYLQYLRHAGGPIHLYLKNIAIRHNQLQENIQGNIDLNTQLQFFSPYAFIQSLSLKTNELNFKGFINGKSNLTVQINSSENKEKAQANFITKQKFIMDWLKKGFKNANIKILSELNIKNLQINTIQLQKGQYQLAAYLTAYQKNPIANVDLNLQLSQFKSTAESILQNAKATLNVKKKHLSFSGKWENPELQATWQLIGNMKNTQLFFAKIVQLNLADKKSLLLSLKQPFELQTNAQNYISWLPCCLRSPFGIICIQKGFFQNKNKQLKGDLQIDTEASQYLANLLPMLEKPEAKLHVNVAVDGKINQPNWTANLSLLGKTGIKALGIQLNPIQLNANLSKNKIYYKGKLQGNTALLLSGVTEINHAFSSTLQLQGEQFKLMDTKQAKIQITPAINASYAENKLKITGNIYLPYATITPSDFSSATTLPKEVVYTDQLSKNENKETPLTLDMQVKLTLGKDIILKYAGLYAKLTGNLDLFTVPNGDIHANGQISVLEGHYKAYGQSLDIRKGSQLIYTGENIENPGLNLAAIRQINNINTSTTTNNNSVRYARSQQTVGVKVSGTLDDPELTLFAEPNNLLSQADILAYLLFGQSAGQTAGGPNAATLIGALSSLNFNNESGLKNSLEHNLGVQVGLDKQAEYDPENESVVNNTSLSLSKAISSKLFLNYSLGLISPINIFTITYKLTQNFKLQSNYSTAGSGVDLFYER